MLRLLLAALAICVAGPAFALSLAAKQALGPPGWVSPYQPNFQFNFKGGAAWKGAGTGGGAVVSPDTMLTVTRASIATNLIPTSPAGVPYATFVDNQLAVIPTVGALFYTTRTNFLLNSATPATQTTASLANGVYTLWARGPAGSSATMSSGTATGCGTGVATTGVAINFTTTGAAGTCTVTVAGALTEFQLELSAFGTSFIPTAGVTLARAAETVTVTPMPPLGSGYTLYTRGAPLAPLSFANAQTSLTINDATANNRAMLFRQGTTGNLFGFVITAGVTLLNSSIGAAATGVMAGSAVALAVDDRAASLSGGAVISNVNAGAATASTNIRIGADYNGFAWNGLIDLPAVWATSRLSNNALRDLTR